MSEASSPRSLKPGGESSPASDPTHDIAAAADTRGGGLRAPLASTIDFAPQAVVGPYQILKKLGQGGMGAVYQARHVKLDKLVALKVLAPHLVGDAEALQRFEREMKAVGKLEHPNIVRAMDAGQVGDTHYLVMEYVEGTDLQRVVKTDGPRPIGDACRLVRQAALALAYAHAHGLVHRDLKPSNLLLTSEGQLKVLDLGLARLNTNADSLTSSGASLGTPDYMAPEQWTDMRLVDHRSDLYALGCTLFYLLTGRPPFGDEQHGSAASKMAGHVSGAIPSLAAALPGVPHELEVVYQRLLSKQREDRPASALELAELLSPFADSEPSWAFAPRPRPSSKDSVSKRQGLIAWIGGGVLTLAALAALGVYLANSGSDRTPLPDKSQVAKSNEQVSETPTDGREPQQPEDDDPTSIPTSPPIAPEDVPEISIMDDDLPRRPPQRTRPRADEGITVKLDEISGSIRRDGEVRPPAIAELVGHSGPIRGATFSASGRYLATASDDRTVRIWDLKLWKPVACLRGYAGSVRCAAFSSNDELVAWSGAGYFGVPVLVWNLKTGKLEASFEFANEVTSDCQVDAVAFSPDGSLLAAGCNGGGGFETPESVRTWKVDTGDELDHFSGDSHNMSLRSEDVRGVVAFSADGTRLFRLTKGDDHFGRMRAGKGRDAKGFGAFGQEAEKGSLLSWLLEDRSPTPREVPTGNVFALALPAKDRTLAAAAGVSERFGRLGGLPGDTPRPANQCELWESTGERTASLDTRHKAITALGLSPDGVYLVTGGDDNVVKLWDIKQVLAK
jgi:serine/threonine protein kinase